MSWASWTAPAGTPAGLQELGQLEAVLLAGPLGEVPVEGVLVGEAALLVGEAGIVGPVGRAHHAHQRRPLRLVEHGDGDPPVVAERRVHPVRRGVGPLEAVPGAGSPAGGWCGR